MSARRLLAVVAVLALLAGCGDKGPTSLQVLQAAQAKTVAAQTSKIRLTIALADTPDKPAFSGDGVYNFSAQRGRFTIDMTALGLSGETELLLVGDAGYLKSSGALAQLAQGKQWIKLSTEQSAGRSVLTQTDPAGLLSSLQGLVGKPSDLGEAQVRGVATTHYRATIDLRAAAEANGASTEQLAAIDAQGATVTSDIWVDAEGRVARMQIERGGSPPAVITIELFDFGTTVEVEAPPRDQVSEQNPLQAPAG